MAHCLSQCVGATIRQEQYGGYRPGWPTAASKYLKRNNSADSETVITLTSLGCEMVVSISECTCQETLVYKVFSLLLCTDQCIIVMVLVFTPLLGRSVALQGEPRWWLSLPRLSLYISGGTYCLPSVSQWTWRDSHSLSSGTAVMDLFASRFQMEPVVREP